jgi:perosamine synthetase
MGSKEYILVKKVLGSNYLNDGDITACFEKKLAKRLECRFALSVTSGTIALFAALKGLGIGRGDEVIVPDVTFIATANAVTLTGAKPVLVDVDCNNANISVNSFVSALSKHTKAVIPVHVSGRAADLEGIRNIADKYGIYIVEDATEALMSKYKGKYLGTFGKAGAISFSPNKIITTGQGGAVLTDDKVLYRKLRMLKDQGRPFRGTGGNDKHYVVGYNFKFTNLQAAVGLGQLELIIARIKKMKEIYNLYRDSLRGVKGITLFKFDVEKGELPLWIDAIAEKRDLLYEYLLKKGIQCRKFWHPLHKQNPYRQASKHFSISSQLCKKALWLPSAFTLTKRDIQYVSGQIKEFYS